MLGVFQLYKNLKLYYWKRKIIGQWKITEWVKLRFRRNKKKIGPFALLARRSYQLSSTFFYRFINWYSNSIRKGADINNSQKISYLPLKLYYAMNNRLLASSFTFFFLDPSWCSGLTRSIFISMNSKLLWVRIFYKNKKIKIKRSHCCTALYKCFIFHELL